MKYTLLTTCCCTIILLFSFCNGNKEKNDSLISIDIEANVKNMQQINLSQFTESIRYVPLETYDYLTFNTWSLECNFTDSLILANDLRNCLLYDYKGKFISKIGNQGRGPGEYLYVSNVGFGLQKKINMQSQNDLLEYRLDGSFANKYKDCFISNDHYFYSWCPLDDSLFFGLVTNNIGPKEYKALIVDKQGNVKYSFKRYLSDKRQKLNYQEDKHARIFQFEKKIFFKESYNDTLFYLTDQFRLTPIYNFNFGKFAEPVTERGKNVVGGMFMYYVFQTSNYLFLDCHFGNQFPAKRLTPLTLSGEIPDWMKSMLSGAPPNWYNTKSALGIFNKQTRKLVFCKPTSTDNFLYTSGLYNDIDAGPRFFPKKMVNDSTMVMWINVKQLKDHIASDDFKNNVPKYPEKKKELEELANKLTIFDNLVIMFVTFKK